MNTKEYRAKYSEKAQQIVSVLTLEEKVALMSGNLIDMNKASQKEFQALMAGLKTEENHYNVYPYPAGGIGEDNVPPVLFCDGPRGVVCGAGEATCFPVSMARGASFDLELEEKIGECIGKEISAFGGNYFGGVCINLPYHPGWGRSQETYGEESFHLGQMGSALVKGVQKQNVMACIKHFAFNSMENARFKCSVTCDVRTEKEVFLPHFKDCIDAGAASVMSSYNRYNSVYCGHNYYLLTEVLKGEWDFDGFVMSDFIWGVRDTVEAANGGQDIEMPLTTYFGDRLVKAVKNGFVPMERIDDAVLRIVRTLLAFNDGRKEHGKEVLACPEHVAIARKSAEKSVTLLKNENVLPLNREKIRKIALIGHLADAANLGDYGSSRVRPPYAVTVKQGLENICPKVDILYTDGSNIEEACLYAEQADAVVFVAGYDHDDEGEFVFPEDTDDRLEARGGDRNAGLGLHIEDVELIQTVGPMNLNSTVVLIGGNMIMMTEWIGSVNSVLMAYYPGMEGGNAIADILFGNVNPSGKLPFVVPYEEQDLPYVDWEAKEQYYEYYHGYTRLEKNGIKPLMPYGFGMSYTSFEYSDIQAGFDGEKLSVTGKIRNTGKIKGTEVAEMYVGFENSKADRPLKQLRGFMRVELSPGEEKEIMITCPADKLKYYEPCTRQWILENMIYTIYLGKSSSNDDLISTQIMIREGQ